jgi:hypothetical protein
MPKKGPGSLSPPITRHEPLLVKLVVISIDWRDASVIVAVIGARGSVCRINAIDSLRRSRLIDFGVLPGIENDATGRQSVFQHIELGTERVPACPHGETSSW